MMQIRKMTLRIAGPKSRARSDLACAGYRPAGSARTYQPRSAPRRWNFASDGIDDVLVQMSVGDPGDSCGDDTLPPRSGHGLADAIESSWSRGILRSLDERQLCGI
jgi:hypothetical protein